MYKIICKNKLYIITSMYNVRDQLCFKVLTISKKWFKDYIVEVLELLFLVCLVKESIASDL